MLAFKLAIVTVLIALTAAGYDHGHGSSYHFVTKHEEPHHHYGGDEGYDGGNGGYDGGNGGYGAGGGDDDGHGHGHYVDYYHSPHYTFDYGVKDPHTGDNKKQWESRHGDTVKGGYMLHEPDGTTRVVEYTSDHKNGFNAVVKRIGHAHHPQIYGHGHEDGHEYGHGHGHGHDASSYANIHHHH